MAARQVDFTLHAGDYKILEFSVVNSANAAVPLGGVQSIKWWAAKTVKATTYLIQKSIGSGVTVIDDVGGVVQVVLLGNDTELLGGKELYHEMEIVDSNGYPQTVLYGTMTINRRLIPNS